MPGIPNHTESKFQHHKLLFVVLLFALYIASETVLRRFIFEAAAYRTDSSSNIRGMIVSLPSFIRVPVEHRMKIQELKASVLSAKSPVDKINMSYILAAELPLLKRLILYQDLLTTYPRYRECMKAMLALTTAPTSGKSITDLIAFVDGCDGTTSKVSMWCDALPVMSSRNEDDKLLLLRALVRNRVQHATLLDFYRDMRGAAVKTEDTALVSAVVELTRGCDELRGFSLQREARQKARIPERKRR